MQEFSVWHHVGFFSSLLPPTFIRLHVGLSQLDNKTALNGMRWEWKTGASWYYLRALLALFPTTNKKKYFRLEAQKMASTSASTWYTPFNKWDFFGFSMKLIASILGVVPNKQLSIFFTNPKKLNKTDNDFAIFYASCFTFAY